MISHELYNGGLPLLTVKVVSASTLQVFVPYRQ